MFEKFIDVIYVVIRFISHNGISKFMIFIVNSFFQSFNFRNTSISKLCPIFVNPLLARFQHKNEI